MPGAKVTLSFLLFTFVVADEILCSSAKEQLKSGSKHPQKKIKANPAVHKQQLCRLVDCRLSIVYPAIQNGVTTTYYPNKGAFTETEDKIKSFLRSGKFHKSIKQKHPEQGRKELGDPPCCVVCLQKNSSFENMTRPLQPIISTQESKDDEESDEDGYQEGEDTPIEATIKPNNIQKNLVVNGIRPFGNVDFIGMDDFGPTGELARDIPELDHI